MNKFQKIAVQMAKIQCLIRIGMNGIIEKL